MLFHGPTSQGRAAEAASRWGRSMGVFGDPKRGLNIEALRAAAEVISTPPVGDRRGAVIIGPMDILSQEGVVDALLKSIEEFDPELTRPYLWAWDIGGVRPTIRSRCVTEWCPGSLPLDQAMLEAAQSVVSAHLSGSTSAVLEAFATIKASWKDAADDFMVAVAHTISSRRDEEAVVHLWGRVRPLFRGTPSYNEAVLGFLP